MVSELSAPGLHWGIISRGIPLPASFLFSMTSTFILWSTISVTARTHMIGFTTKAVTTVVRMLRLATLLMIAIFSTGLCSQQAELRVKWRELP